MFGPPTCASPQYGNGTLRLTTRQCYQLHGVLKHDLKTVFSTVIKNMGSTLGACGDVNRNVMGPAAPWINKPGYKEAQKLANDLADLLAPQSGAYYDVWLDGEKFVSVYKEVRRVCACRPWGATGVQQQQGLQLHDCGAWRQPGGRWGAGTARSRAARAALHAVRANTFAGPQGDGGPQVQQVRH